MSRFTPSIAFGSTTTLAPVTRKQVASASVSVSTDPPEDTAKQLAAVSSSESAITPEDTLPPHPPVTPLTQSDHPLSPT